VVLHFAYYNCMKRHNNPTRPVAILNVLPPFSLTAVRVFIVQELRNVEV
jgi:hypothetical protein